MSRRSAARSTATRAVRERLDGYDRLVAAVRASGDADAQAAWRGPVLLNSLVLDLDRRFVHRFRMVAGKDGHPLNEVELIVESLMNNDGVLRGNKVVKDVPEEFVTQLKPGTRHFFETRPSGTSPRSRRGTPPRGARTAPGSARPVDASTEGDSTD